MCAFFISFVRPRFSFRSEKCKLKIFRFSFCAESTGNSFSIFSPATRHYLPFFSFSETTTTTLSQYKVVSFRCCNEESGAIQSHLCLLELKSTEIDFSNCSFKYISIFLFKVGVSEKKEEREMERYRKKTVYRSIHGAVSQNSHPVHKSRCWL